MEGKINTAEYEKWKETHNCSVNHEGSASKMEMDGISEMFHRSEGLHETKYLNYIGYGDRKTFAGLLASPPYGEPVKKKECVGHVQKRMGTRLRNLKKKTKGLGGKGHGKLTAKLIDELTVYYRKAIRNSCNSITQMKRGIGQLSTTKFLRTISRNIKIVLQETVPGVHGKRRKLKTNCMNTDITLF